MKKYSLEQIKSALFNHDFCGERAEESIKKRTSVWRSVKTYLIDHENDYEVECEKLKKEKDIKNKH